ncbi:MAG: radical SAM protein [Lachnospiraceae bacterium]|nr:radical SAM protein [Lachnospiraceae bacterium]
MATRKTLVVQMFITDECDQRCDHCYIFGEDPNKRPKSMSFEVFRSAADKLISYSRQSGVSLSWGIAGGDPLLHPRFWDFAGYLKKNGFSFVMIGNPFHLSAEVCERLYDYGCMQYQMSLDGLKENHDRNRRKGSFDATVNCFSMIHAAGMDSGVRSMVSEKNISDIPAIVDLCVKHRVSDFAFSRYAPVGGGKNNIKPLEYRKLLDICYKKFEEYRKQGCWTSFGEKDHLFLLYKYEEGIVRLSDDPDSKELRYGCSCAVSPGKVRILHDGTVMACRRALKTRLGNILTDRMDDVLASKKCYTDISRYEACSNCRLVLYCRGCPAVSEGQYGDFFKRDPQCWHVVE